MVLEADVLDLGLRIVRLRARFEGLRVTLGPEQWEDYAKPVTHIPAGLFVGTGWMFGDYKQDVAMWYRAVQLVKPSAEEVASKKREFAPLSAATDLSGQVLGLEQHFSGLRLGVDTPSTWAPWTKSIGDTPHKVPDDGPNVLTAVSIGRRNHDCSWSWASLKLTFTRNEDQVPGDGSLEVRIERLERQLDALRVTVGPNVQGKWNWLDNEKLAVAPLGSAFAGIQWESWIYSRTVGLSWE